MNCAKPGCAAPSTPLCHIGLEGALQVEFRHVSVRLGGVSILEDVNAVVPAGSCTVIVGPNGAGKTTLLLALLGEVPYTGQIVLRRAPTLLTLPTQASPINAAGDATERSGQEHSPCDLQNREGHCGIAPDAKKTLLSRSQLRFAYVPQRMSLDRGMPLTVTEFLAMSSQTLPLWLGVQKVYRRRALEHLEKVGAAHLATRRLGALSGGEMQRVMLAQALQRQPDVMVLDEPSAGVDFQGEHLFCQLLDALRQEYGFTQIMVSHDLGMVAHHATHVIGLNRQVEAEGPPCAVLTGEVLQRLFGPHMGIIHAGFCADSCRDCAQGMVLGENLPGRHAGAPQPCANLPCMPQHGRLKGQNDA